MKNRRKKNFILVIMGLSIMTYLTCVFILTRWYVQNERNKVFIKSLNNEVNTIVNKEKNINNYIIPKAKYNSPENQIKQDITYQSDINYLNIDLNKYLNKNKETVGWIQVNGTNINYPIVQHNDNNYYLNHDFYNRNTNIGWIFADYRNNLIELDYNTIIYGHNLLNRTMFGQIPNLLKSKWQKNKKNYYIKLTTKKEKSIWEIFSIYEIAPVSDYLQTKFESEEEYKNFLKIIRERSKFVFKTDLTSTDKIITLSTCNDAGNKRIVVHAKLYMCEKN